jgi:hypothetical protein
MGSKIQMSLSKELEKLKYDKRLIDWHVSRGKFPKEELQKYLASLPDLANNVDHFGLGDEGRGSVGGYETNGNGQY